MLTPGDSNEHIIDFKKYACVLIQLYFHLPSSINNNGQHNVSSRSVDSGRCEANTYYIFGGSENAFQAIITHTYNRLSVLNVYLKRTCLQKLKGDFRIVLM